MDLLDFFDLTKTIKPVIIEGSHTEKRLRRERENLVVGGVAKQYKKKEYAEEYRKKEEEEIKAVMMNTAPSDSTEKSLTQLDELTSVFSSANINELVKEELTKVYDLYDFNQRSVKSLPITEHKQKIVSVIDTNQVTIIQGSTGCGKTTQIPQFILDSCYEKGDPCNIIVTQPRRIAAISVAKRVCQERGWQLGSLVGYQIGLKAEVSPDTRLMYCTTGVLLQKLIATKHMNNFTHIILDEVHERDEDTDLVLLVVRRMLRSSSRHVKVILMSATISVSKFSKYFSFPMNNRMEPAPVIDIDKYLINKHKFKISIYYLNELEKIGPLPEITVEEPSIQYEAYCVATKLIQHFDHLEKGQNKLRGAVLVFLPGIREIEELYNILDSYSKQYKWWIKPLHSTITTDEQEVVFQRPPPEHRKIILSTNIAESSVTVPDIVYVVDFCLTKELICEPDTNYTILQLCWASKTNCIQRAGRSGRVADGRVYRLVPQDFYDHYMLDEGIPEMLRSPLAKVVLNVKLLDMGEPKALLALALDPPDLSNIESTILLLKEAGAMLPTVNGKHSDYDGDITFMGRVMAKLPVDINLAKLILLGHIFSVLEECIIMGAAMSVKSIFSAPFKKRLDAYHSKLTWADSSCSDCIAFLNAYKVWHFQKITGYFKRSAGGGEKQWGKTYYIQLSAMHEVDVFVRELKHRLRGMEIEETTGTDKVVWSESERPLILKIVMAGAFYPNYFVRSAQGGQIDERQAVKELAGRDPYSSVFLQGMPMNQPGRLYVSTIKKALERCAQDMRVSFDGSTKVYVEFGRPFETQDDRKLSAKIPGRVSMAVYMAVKLRQLRIPIEVNMMLPHLAAERVKQLGLPMKEHRMSLDNMGSLKIRRNALPSIATSSMDILITHVIDPGHFWAHKLETDAVSNETILFRELNKEPLPPLSRTPKVGTLYVAPYSESSNSPVMFYRARVNGIIPRKNQDTLVEVFFVDYGNIQYIPVRALRDFSPKNISDGLENIPPLAIECVLCELKPSLLKNPSGVWSEEALREFKQMTEGKILTAKIFSVVYGIVSLELFNKHNLESINKNLIKMGYAEPAEESYLSKINNEMRGQQEEWSSEEMKMYDSQQEPVLSWDEDVDPDPPKPEECRIMVTLKGPRSPLEMKLYNLTKAGQRREVVIDGTSVNSVLLDTDPQDPHERMLVAAEVGLNPTASRMNLRHTTLLPNVHGLPAILCLLFAPAVEMRTNSASTRYTGALCGLGYNPKTNESLFPDHDLEVTFDTEITNDDMQTINRLRYWMSMALYTEEYQETLEAGAAQIVKYQHKIKDLLFELLKAARNDVQMVVTLSQFRWNQIPEGLLMSPGEVPGTDRAIYRLHKAVDLQEEDGERLKMKKHLEYIMRVARGSQLPKKYIRCNLCNVKVTTLSALRIHLETSLHKSKEMNIISEC